MVDVQEEERPREMLPHTAVVCRTKKIILMNY